MSYFDDVKPTYLEQWPAALRALSIQSEAVPLTLADAKSLGASIMEYGETFAKEWTLEDQERIAAIANRVRNELANLPGECGFLRLGSRSPKDSWEGRHNGFKVHAGDQNVLRHFQDVSERTSDDLHLAIKENYPPTIWAREWLDIAPHQEWRCFMRDRQLVGISQYEYRDRIDWCVEHAHEVQWEIKRYFPTFRDACHLDSVVFDVVLNFDWKVTLLEVNPFFSYTDPCLFSWKDGGNFDGSIRVQAAVKAKRAESLGLLG